jgi:hypothetical protein
MQAIHATAQTLNYSGFGQLHVYFYQSIKQNKSNMILLFPAFLRIEAGKTVDLHISFIFNSINAAPDKSINVFISEL